MTISICWQRQFRDINEIIFASDSRLSGGYRWDCAQKVFPIDGPNFVVSFSGNSDFAMPCIFHLQQAVKTYGRYRTGAARIGAMRGDFVKIINQLMEIVDDRETAQFERTNFLISGYDHHTGEAHQKRIMYDRALGRFCARPFNGFQAGGVSFRIGFIGDLWGDFSTVLSEEMRLSRTQLDYQPLKALWRVISRQDKYSSVGGMPQVVKVYKSRNYLPYAVRENDLSQRIFLYGRPLLQHQLSYYPLCSLDKIGEEDFIHYPINSPKRKLTPPPLIGE